MFPETNKMIQKINNERLAETVVKKRNELKAAKEYAKKFTNSANKYLELIVPILKKRGIKIESTQIYFNGEACVRALAHVNFEEVYGDYDSIKVRNLIKDLVEARIPMPCGNPNRGITITLYEETLFENRFKGDSEWV